MYLTKYIERMGTGIRDMIDRCKKVGLPEPEIRIDGGFWVMTIRRHQVLVPGTNETREKTREKILTAIREKTSISTQELPELLGITIKGVEWQLRKLKNEGVLERLGPDKGGHWVAKGEKP